MNRTRNRRTRRPGWFLLPLLALALCGTAAACGGSSNTTSVNVNNGSNCANIGVKNRACDHSANPGAKPGTNPQASDQSLLLWGSDPMLSDPTVQKNLGFALGQGGNDSQPNCSKGNSDIKGYDLSSSSAQGAQCYWQLARANGDSPNIATPYQGLLVIATHKPIVALLEQYGIAYPAPRPYQRVIVFNLRKYLQVYSAAMTWEQKHGDTPGNPYASFLDHQQGQLSITDPVKSTLGALSIDVAFASENGGTPPRSVNPGDPRVRVIRELYDKMSHPWPISGELVSHYFSDGQSFVPMAMMYEDQYLHGIIANTQPDPTRAVMYPTPDLLGQDAIVGFTPQGKALVTKFQNNAQDPLLQSEGFRTGADFTAVMSRRTGIVVPDTDSLPAYGITPVSLPQASVPSDLINAVSKN